MKYKIDAKELFYKLQEWSRMCGEGNTFDIVMEVQERSEGYGEAEHKVIVPVLRTEGLRFCCHGQEEKILGPKEADDMIHPKYDND